MENISKYFAFGVMGNKPYMVLSFPVGCMTAPVYSFCVKVYSFVSSLSTSLHQALTAAKCTDSRRYRKEKMNIIILENKSISSRESPRFHGRKFQLVLTSKSTVNLFYFIL